MSKVLKQARKAVEQLAGGRFQEDATAGAESCGMCVEQRGGHQPAQKRERQAENVRERGMKSAYERQEDIISDFKK